MPPAAPPSVGEGENTVSQSSPLPPAPPGRRSRGSRRHPKQARAVPPQEAQEHGAAAASGSDVCAAAAVPVPSVALEVEEDPAVPLAPATLSSYGSFIAPGSPLLPPLPSPHTTIPITPVLAQLPPPSSGGSVSTPQLPQLLTSPTAAAAHAALAQEQHTQHQRKQRQILQRPAKLRGSSSQQQQYHHGSLRKVSSQLSNSGDADSEPSTGDSTANRSAQLPLPSLPLSRRQKSHSIEVLSSAAEQPLFGQERLHADGEQRAASGRWRVSSSQLNLTLSNQLSTQFHSSDDDALAPAGYDSPVVDAAPDASSASGGVPYRSFHWLKRLLSPWIPLSGRATVGYLLLSVFLFRTVRRANAPVRRNLTMLTFAPPMVSREAPHLLALLIALGAVRTAWPHRAAFTRLTLPSLSLLVSWLLNGLTIAKLATMFREMLRTSARSFREQLAAARVPLPKLAPQREESVLTIAPAHHFADASNAIIPLHDTASKSAALTPSLEGLSTPAFAAAGDSVDSSLMRAYRRIGHMSPLRWFLTCTQLSFPLARLEGIQWRTGVKFDVLHARNKVRALKLDLYRPKDVAATKPLPVFLYVHGGGWMTGHRSFHSLTMLYAIAKAGFLVVSINYRLSPFVKHPTHVMDCKRALIWIRTHAEALGADPSFVVVGGESAGAHLACLLALTPNNPHLQPGEGCDTSVQGVVDLYGPHDFLDRGLHFRSREEPAALFGGFDVFLHRFVMGEEAREAEGAYAMASPLHRLMHAEELSAIPPFFSVHGTHDDLIPLGDSEEFYKELGHKRREATEAHQRLQRDYEERMREWEEDCKRVGQAGIGAAASLPPRPLPPPPLPEVMDVFVRLPGASHAFNNVMGPRTFALNDSVTAWILALFDRHQQQQKQAGPASPPPQQPLVLSSRL